MLVGSEVDLKTFIRGHIHISSELPCYKTSFSFLRLVLILCKLYDAKFEAELLAI